MIPGESTIILSLELLITFMTVFIDLKLKINMLFSARYKCTQITQFQKIKNVVWSENVKFNMNIFENVNCIHSL